MALDAANYVDKELERRAQNRILNRFARTSPKCMCRTVWPSDLSSRDQ